MTSTPNRQVGLRGDGHSPHLQVRSEPRTTSSSYQQQLMELNLRRAELLAEQGRNIGSLPSIADLQMVRDHSDSNERFAPRRLFDDSSEDLLNNSGSSSQGGPLSSSQGGSSTLSQGGPSNSQSGPSSSGGGPSGSQLFQTSTSSTSNVSMGLLKPSQPKYPIFLTGRNFYRVCIDGTQHSLGDTFGGHDTPEVVFVDNLTFLRYRSDLYRILDLGILHDPRFTHIVLPNQLPVLQTASEDHFVFIQGVGMIAMGHLELGDLVEVQGKVYTFVGKELVL